MFLVGNHAMVDIETLSTRVSAKVLQVAIVVFNSYGILDEKSWVLSPHQQLSRFVDNDTLKFWLSTAPLKLVQLLDGRSKVEDVINGAEKLNSSYGIKGWWANSPSFDLVILEDLFRLVRGRGPWSHRNCYDVRTLKLLAGGSSAKSKEPHDALADARAQAVWVIERARSWRG